ncbi:hypothetical protein POSPLADRAFT_1181232 [Postia placenta MAD-698-R-SB12]|uniref:Uncharacterized protein n=1 Tax=Postia placenta MAD-698-R-SB12 TaxID=670580 RepID=A0A1X6N0H6_9APHY|nr:hypothetical protein POSPLADRAFT_1181232 [Postia placenta MAD-698-R-SB12]OSX62002.1 hypothetical protein POSPLADRAFT_1181232 [Postia placenta MAD-698-R-SB12]
MSDSAARPKAAQALSPLWTKALERLENNTGMNLLNIADNAEPRATEVKRINDTESLISVLQARRNCDKKFAKALDGLLTSVNNISQDIEKLLAYIPDGSGNDLRKEMIFRSLGLLFLGVTDGNGLEAVSRLFAHVPRINEDIGASVLLGTSAVIERILVSYIVLAGNVYKTIDTKRRNSFDAQFQRGWDRVLRKYAGLIGTDTKSSGAPVMITSAQKLAAKLSSQCRQLNVKPTDETRIKESIRALAESVISMEVKTKVYQDVDSVILGSLFSLTQAARGKSSGITHIVDLIATLTDILIRVLTTATVSSSVGILFVRVKAQVMTIFGEAIRLLNRAYSAPRWPLKGKSSSPSFLHDEQLQGAVGELSWLVEAAVDGPSHSEESASEFSQLWEKAKMRYLADSGLNISFLSSVERGDSLAALETALHSGRYSFLQEHKNAHEIEKLLIPVIRFVKPFVKPAGKLLEPHLPGATFAAAAIEILLDAADRFGATYEPILTLFSTLSDYLSRIRVHESSGIDPVMMKIHVEVLCELLKIMGIVTGHINKGYLGECIITDQWLDRLVSGGGDVQSALKRLEALVDAEGRMTGALVLSRTNDIKHGVDAIQESIGKPISTMPPALTDSSTRRPKFPPKPSLFIGRQEQRKDVAEAVLSRRPTIVLGAGGIGKTTVVTQALYDAQIISQFPYRYFVSCEDIITLDGLHHGIADALGIPAELRNEQLPTRVLHELGQRPSILFLDNFETLFDVAAVRRAVETELEAYACVDRLALVVTMRGAEAPATGRIQWAKVLLTPLSHEEGVALFRSTALIPDVINDPFVDSLVDAVDSLPLAVTLLAHQVQPELGTTTRALWSRWEKKHVEMVTRSDGARDRLLDLSTSIDLSINSPRMQHEPSAKSVMALLAQLPSGLPLGTDTSEQMQSALEDSVDLSLSLQTLCRVGLAYTDTNGTHPRYRMLAPIREYCRGHPGLQPSGSLWESLSTFYSMFVTMNRNYGEPECLAVVPPEIPNIRQVLASRDWKTEAIPSAIRAAVDYTDWLDFLGAPSVELLQLCIAHVRDNELLGDCHYTMATVYRHLNRYDDVETALDLALKHHRASSSQQGQANDLQDLAWMYQYRGDLTHARDSLKEALSLHSAIGDRLGEANVLRSLGELIYRQDDYDNAEAYLNDALSLYHAINERLGGANTLQSLGDVYCRRDDFDNAEHTYKKAASLHHSLQGRLGEATAHRNLAMMYILRGDLDEAEASSRIAHDLFRTIHHQHGQADCLQDLGEIHLLREDFTDAEISLKNALFLHQAVQDRIGETNDLTFLGEIYMKLNRDAEAEKVLCDAVKLCRTNHDPLSEGNTLETLGSVYTKMERFDEAEMSLIRAVELHRGMEGTEENIRRDETALEELRQAREEFAREASTLTEHQ